LNTLHRPADNWFESLPKDRLMAEISLWSADLGRLVEDTRRIEPFTDIFHVDVSDGHFSPAMLFFPDLLASVRKVTAKPIHVHLMVTDAILMDQVAQFAEVGADLISVHAENSNAVEALAAIKKAGLKTGVVLQLHTQVKDAAHFMPHIDMFTLLGTRMGIKGVGLDDQAPARLREARALVAGAGRRIIVAADGGIRDNTVPELRAAGAETIVMGSLAFGAADLKSRFDWVHAQK
jgi:ribulose-phosphate 3-epimerase